MNENELATVVLKICFDIHQKWGPGLLETVYETLLAHHLINSGFFVEQQKTIPFVEDGVTLTAGFRADIVVENKLIIELKSIESLHPVHAKILLTYLRLSGIKLGLLVNFGGEMLKDGIKRLIHGQIN